MTETWDLLEGRDESGNWIRLQQVVSILLIEVRSIRNYLIENFHVWSSSPKFPSLYCVHTKANNKAVAENKYFMTLEAASDEVKRRAEDLKKKLYIDSRITDFDEILTIISNIAAHVNEDRDVDALAWRIKRMCPELYDKTVEFLIFCYIERLEISMEQMAEFLKKFRNFHDRMSDNFREEYADLYMKDLCEMILQKKAEYIVRKTKEDEKEDD